MLIDAHAHFERQEELAARAGMRTVFCGTDPNTAAALLPLRGKHIWASFGLHPWYADRWDAQAMLPYIRQGVAVGEIGLDSVWCQADMDRQRAVFKTQLDFAEALHMPVILHTKGMEREIAAILEGYSMPKLVHWYSCPEHLTRYLEQDCYFTVGADYADNPAVQSVLRRAPLNRVLTETDGLNALAWALGRPAGAGEIEIVIRGELKAIALVHGISPQDAEAQVAENFERFYSPRPAI